MAGRDQCDFAKQIKKNRIDLVVSEIRGAKWRFKGMYGEPQSEMKYKTWDLLEWLHAQDSTFCRGYAL